MSLLDFQVGFTATDQRPCLDSHSSDLPVQIGSLDVAQSVRLGTTQQHHVGRNKAVCGQSDDVTDSDFPPWPRLELLVDKDFGFIIVQRSVRGVSFLTRQRDHSADSSATDQILLDFLESTSNENHTERHNGGESAGGETLALAGCRLQVSARCAHGKCGSYQ